MPQTPKGTMTVTDDDIAQTLAQAEVQEATMPKPPSSTWWDRANKGFISPDRFLKWATSGQFSKVEDLEKMRDQPPSVKESPEEAYSRTFHTGFTSELAKTASSLTSPVTIGTGLVSQAAKLSNAMGKTARAILAMEGIGFGVSGARDVGQGIQQGYNTPEGSQKILAGASQIAGAAPAVAEVGRAGIGVLEKVAPQLFAKGEGAFVAALAPPAKKVPKLREAYQNRAQELKTAPIKDLHDLSEFAEAKRNEAAQELNREISRINPQATIVDRFAVGDAIRKRVTTAISLSSPQEAKVMLDYADRVQQEFFQNPVDLAKADSLVIELNKRSTLFDNMPEAQQKTRLAMGDPILAEKALKIALQDQIEAKLTNYRDLKRRWGDWNEISDQTQTRLNDLERKGTNVGYAQRRALESLFSAGGAAGALMHGGGAVEGAIGGAGGFMLGRFAADQVLNRLSSPENALARGLRPSAPQQRLPFLGQVTQPVASQLAGPPSDQDVDKILDQMMGVAPNAEQP